MVNNTEWAAVNGGKAPPVDPEIHVHITGAFT